MGPIQKGRNFKLYHPVFIGFPEKIKVGDNVVINAFVHIWAGGGIEIGDNVMIASHCAITSTTHNTNSTLFNDENIHQKIIIGSNVWIGAHCVIVPGITIGDNVVIGANSFVNRDLEANAVYVGSPAKKIKAIER
ncbi:hypothetical protein BC349_08310 [Flavihumibacter stibioxidans]|uniref:Acyltransferase n=1 Tax=Flavihumibacter stibioxidans TaxID=1834163 RepID=A0ABR7M7J6_9BACT|nr:hypothetical protein [Flavihumibacter stibioxidans]